MLLQVIFQQVFPPEIFSHGLDLYQRDPFSGKRKQKRAIHCLVFPCDHHALLVNALCIARAFSRASTCYQVRPPNAMERPWQGTWVWMQVLLWSWLSHCDLLEPQVPQQVEWWYSPPMECFGYLLSEMMDGMHLTRRRSRQWRPSPSPLSSHCLFLKEAWGGRASRNHNPLFTGEESEMQGVCDLAGVTLLVRQNQA